jgi:2-polyprenyl-3-methyl-5-hydroxy-6-metoxy-1,4-benzoquinol methylase
MDDLTTSNAGLVRALNDFKIINRLISRTRGLLLGELLPHMRRQASRPVSVLDVGSGGCDIGLWLARVCRREGLAVRIICLDSDPRAIAYARTVCADTPSITVVQANALDIESAVGPVDYIIANHFLHHIDDEHIPGLLAALDRAARHGFLVTDLRRSWWAFVGFTLVASLLWPRGFTCHDGRVSICRGFLESELRAFVEQAGLTASTRVWRRFPARICVSTLR